MRSASSPSPEPASAPSSRSPVRGRRATTPPAAPAGPGRRARAGRPARSPPRGRRPRRPPGSGPGKSSRAAASASARGEPLGVRGRLHAGHERVGVAVVRRARESAWSRAGRRASPPVPSRGRAAGDGASGGRSGAAAGARARDAAFSREQIGQFASRRLWRQKRGTGSRIEAPAGNARWPAGVEGAVVGRPLTEEELVERARGGRRRGVRRPRAPPPGRRLPHRDADHPGRRRRRGGRPGRAS